MTFTTLTFIVFLVITFSIYWALRQRFAQNVFLVVMSYVFYGWWDYRFCLFLFATSLVDFCVGLRMANTENPRSRKWLLLTSLVFNLSVLCFFKYWNFFTDSFIQAVSVLGWKPDIMTVRVILPVGISFYTFQTLTYTIDIYRRQLQPTRNLINYLCYLSFFPQLVAGPIERASHLLPQVLNSRTFNPSLAYDGCRQMLWGFFKKMAIADNLAPIVQHAYSTDPSLIPGPQLAVATGAFAIQIYCDFSAYSDIAIGCARLFGFDLMQNFAYPYFSQSIAEFWRRWHISLSTWLKDYVYIPLGGSRVSPSRGAINVLLTFLVSGIWHGAAWTYVIWGGIHGGLILIERLWTKSIQRVSDVPGGTRLFPDVWTLVRMIVTFTMVCAAWVFFRASTVGGAVMILRQIMTDALRPSAYRNLTLIFQPSQLEVPVLLSIVAAFLLLEWFQRHQAHPLKIEKWAAPIRWLIYTTLLWITLFWGTWNTGQFVYFQF